MLQRMKHFGSTPEVFQTYFDSKCKSFDDVVDLIKESNTKMLNDMTPCIESFITKSNDIPNDFIDKMIIADNATLNKFADIAIEQSLNDIENSNVTWHVWSDIPAIETMYRTGKLNSDKISILESALNDCADKVLNVLSPVSNESDYKNAFANEVSLDKMIHWDKTRESVSDNARYVGDLIYNMSKDDYIDIAKESVMSDIDITLSDIAEVLEYANPNMGPHIGYKEMVNDIWYELTNTNRENFDTVVEDIYRSRGLTITTESYISAIKSMISEGCLPRELNSVSNDEFKQLKELLDGNIYPATEKLDLYIDIKNREYNMDMWQRKPNQNILYVTGFSGSGKSTYAKDLARKTPDCIHINTDYYIEFMYPPSQPIGDTNPDYKLVSKFYKEYDKRISSIHKKYDDVDAEADCKSLYIDREKLFMNFIEKEAAKNPHTLYILEGVWFMYDFDPSFFADKPLVVIGTSVKNSFKRKSYRNGYKLGEIDPLSDKYTHRKYEFEMLTRSRRSLLEYMDSPVTEAWLMHEPTYMDAKGIFKCDPNIVTALEMMSFDYITATEDTVEANETEKTKTSNNTKRLEEKKGHNNTSAYDKTVTNVKKATTESRKQLSNAYNKYKNAEDDVDKKLGEAIKTCSKIILGNPDREREKLIEGKDYKVSSILKTILGGYAVFSVSKVGLLLLLVVRGCNSGKIKKQERLNIINELEGELEVLNKKIEYARMDDNRDAEIKLMRTRRNVQNALNRIKRKDLAEIDKSYQRRLSGNDSWY